MATKFQPLSGNGDKIKPHGGVAFRTVKPIDPPRHCFVVDDEQGICHFIAMVLREFDIETSSFASVTAALEALAHRNPCIVFLDISLDGSDAVDAIRGLGAKGYSGPVQLISGRHENLLDEIREIGVKHSLRMLPVLSKPFDADAIRSLVDRLYHDDAAAFPTPLRLDDALRQGWIEFWYQPKIDLKTMALAGVEALARLRHPTLGVLPPGAFLPDADERGLHDLAQLALRTALQDGIELAEAGHDIQFAVNVPAAELASTSLPAILREYRKDSDRWPGLILEVTENQVMGDLGTALEVAIQLKIYGVKLSIDDFGRGYSSLARLKHLPFVELKIDRHFVLDCATDPNNAALCGSAIDIAHRFGCRACAEGIETPEDLRVLADMGCDIGQGYLFAPPMPKERLLSALREGFKLPTAPPPLTNTGDERRQVATV